MPTTTTVELSTPLPPTCSNWWGAPVIIYILSVAIFQQEWDDELAYMAQFWASTCRYEENEDRHSQSATFDYVGESLAATLSYTVNYTQLIGQLWYGEKRYFNYYTASCFDEDGNANDDGSYETCGRYTQVKNEDQNRVVLHLCFSMCSWCGLERML